MTELHRRGLPALGLAAGTATGAAAETHAPKLTPGPKLTPAVAVGPDYLADAQPRSDIPGRWFAARLPDDGPLVGPGRRQALLPKAAT